LYLTYILNLFSN